MVAQRPRPLDAGGAALTVGPISDDADLSLLLTDAGLAVAGTVSAVSQCAMKTGMSAWARTWFVAPPKII